MCGINNIEKGSQSISIQYQNFQEGKKGKFFQIGLLPFITFLNFFVSIVFTLGLVSLHKNLFSIASLSVFIFFVFGVVGLLIMLINSRGSKTINQLKIDGAHETISFFYNGDDSVFMRNFREFSHLSLKQRPVFYGADPLYDRAEFALTLTDRFGVETVICCDKNSKDSVYNLLNDIKVIFPVPVKSFTGDSLQDKAVS